MRSTAGNLPLNSAVIPLTLKKVPTLAAHGKLQF
jgi:hypothetical protein